jgi:glycosyltransferase involved in cell wall biosynthesis
VRCERDGGGANVTGFAGLALLVWLILILLHGNFWQSGPTLAATRPVTAPTVARPVAPPVAIVVPARDEASVIVATLRSLLTQDYPGRYRVILVDDGSTDGTGALAREVATDAPSDVPRGVPREPNDQRLRVLDGTPPPAGWSGKLWAVAQGIDAAIPDGITAATDTAGGVELLLLTDADIVHDPRHLSALVARAEQDGLDLVSEMVTLACDSLAERALVPAFVYFSSCSIRSLG